MRQNDDKLIKKLDQDLETLEPSYIAGRDVKLCSCCGKQIGGSSDS